MHFFKVKSNPGIEDAFNRCIREGLVPLRTRFPGPQEMRLKSREVSKALIDMFDGPVFHTVLSATNTLATPSKHGPSV